MRELIRADDLKKAKSMNSCYDVVINKRSRAGELFTPLKNLNEDHNSRRFLVRLFL